MTLFVGLAMAEVCSSFPTAGGLYYWSAKLAPGNPAAWSWFTGWFKCCSPTTAEPCLGVPAAA